MLPRTVSSFLEETRRRLGPIEVLVNNAVRFALALFLAYAVFFAITAGTTRTAGYVLAIIGGIIVVQVLLEAAGVHVSLIPFIGDRLILWPGPLEIFSGRWMLIDV